MIVWPLTAPDQDRMFRPLTSLGMSEGQHSIYIRGSSYES